MRRFGGGERRRGERRYLISWWLKTNKQTVQLCAINTYQTTKID
jgi:hypothetical protein